MTSGGDWRWANGSRRKSWSAREFRRAMTPEEPVLWQALRKNQAAGFHFRRQQVIDGFQVIEGFIVDFFCHRAGLVVEVDGGVQAERADYDAVRDAPLRERDLRIHRVSNEDVRTNLRGVLHQIKELCQEAPLTIEVD